MPRKKKQLQNESNSKKMLKMGQRNIWNTFLNSIFNFKFAKKSFKQIEPKVYDELSSKTTLSLSFLFVFCFSRLEIWNFFYFEAFKSFFSKLRFQKRLSSFTSGLLGSKRPLTQTPLKQTFMFNPSFVCFTVKTHLERTMFLMHLL